MPLNSTDITHPRDPVQASLWDLLSRWLDAVREGTGHLPSLSHDEDWPSPCVVEGPDAASQVRWHPLSREERADFSGIEHALETRLHPDIQSFSGSFYSTPVPMRAPDGKLTLLQVWSDRDFDRLLENLIGHALAQRRAGTPFSLFIAVTDEDDLNLCVNNEHGNVVLERPGEPPLREVASSLVEFLDDLEPLLPDDSGDTF